MREDVHKCCTKSDREDEEDRRDRRYDHNCGDPVYAEPCYPLESVADATINCTDIRCHAIHQATNRRNVVEAESGMADPIHNIPEHLATSRVDDDDHDALGDHIQRSCDQRVDCLGYEDGQDTN